MLHFLRKRSTKTTFGQEEEQGLIERYKRSCDPALVAQLFDPYTHLVFGLCMKYLNNEDDSKDAVMQVYENILHDLKTHEVRNFKSWLYIVSKNHCLKIIRRAKQDQKYAELSKAEKSTGNMDYETSLSHTIDGVEHKKKDALHEAILQLKPQQRQCIELVYLQGKSYKEVVEITGFEMKKVKSYVQNGKRKLRIILEQHEEFNELFGKD